MTSPMFNEPPKVIVNEYKSLDDELSALATGLFIEGRQSHDWVIDWSEEAKNSTIPTHVALIKRAIARWDKSDD